LSNVIGSCFPRFPKTASGVCSIIYVPFNCQPRPYAYKHGPIRNGWGLRTLSNADSDSMGSFAWWGGAGPTAANSQTACPGAGPPPNGGAREQAYRFQFWTPGFLRSDRNTFQCARLRRPIIRGPLFKTACMRNDSFPANVFAGGANNVFGPRPAIWAFDPWPADFPLRSAGPVVGRPRDFLWGEQFTPR